MKKHFLFCILIIALLLIAAAFAAIGLPKSDSDSTNIVLETQSASPTTASPSYEPTETPAETVFPSAAPTPESSPAVKETTAPVETPVSTPAITEEPPAISTPEASPEVTSPPVSTPAPDVSYEQIDLSSPALLGETEDMGQDYLDKIIFLGDSTTYGLKAYGVLSGGKNTTQVWTPTSGTLTLSYQSFAAIWYPDEETEIPIRDAVQRKQPEMMIITLGVNGISFMNKEDFVAEYTDLVQDIQELSPDTKIIIQSIFPIAYSYEYKGSINNERICRANTWLLEIAENTGVRYLNTISVLMGSDGYMPESFQNGDGLHLNGESFRIVLNYIRTHGYI